MGNFKFIPLLYFILIPLLLLAFCSIAFFGKLSDGLFSVISIQFSWVSVQSYVISCHGIENNVEVNDFRHFLKKSGKETLKQVNAAS